MRSSAGQASPTAWRSRASAPGAGSVATDVEPVRQEMGRPARADDAPPPTIPTRWIAPSGMAVSSPRPVPAD